MIEKVFNLSDADKKTIEKIICDENIHYMHMILPEGEALPEHYSNSNVYMTVAKGMLTIALDSESTREYACGTLLKIPHQTKMNVVNRHAETLELIVVKAPAPKAQF